MSKWIYQRKDAGIPGLPHEITEEEAAERGLTKLLKDAVEAGAYATTPPAAVAAPSPNERASFGEGKKKAKKESEVNDG